MLSRFDDYPIHQTAEPLFHTATSDRFTYDRFWYNAHARDASYYFGIGLCRYPNLGILDCGFSLVVGDQQFAMHGSRRAPNEPTELTVGPFELQILEPMGRHRLCIGANDSAIECELLFTPRSAAIEEGRQTLRNERHLVMDATRLDQFGFWQGWIRYDGKELMVDSADTFGLKDRSWGIRPVGEPYSGGAPLADYQPVHFMWLPIHWDSECSLAGWFENDQGQQWHSDQVILPAYASSDDIPGVVDPDAVVWRGTVEHRIEMRPGTRMAKAGTVLMRDRSGSTREIRLEPVLLHRMKGLGYLHPQWGHGKWHGELAVARETWLNSELDPLALENLHVQQVVRAECEGRVGHGVLEQLHIGPYQPYGFKDWFDGAG